MNKTNITKLLLITILLSSSMLGVGTAYLDINDLMKPYILEHHPETAQFKWIISDHSGGGVDYNMITSGIGQAGEIEYIASDLYLPSQSWFPIGDEGFIGEWVWYFESPDVIEELSYYTWNTTEKTEYKYRSNVVIVNSDQRWWNIENNVIAPTYEHNDKVYIVYGEYPETSNILIRLGLVTITVDEPEREVKEYIFEPAVDIMQMIKDIMQMSREMREMLG